MTGPQQGGYPNPNPEPADPSPATPTGAEPITAPAGRPGQPGPATQPAPAGPPYQPGQAPYPGGQPGQPPRPVNYGPPRPGSAYVPGPGATAVRPQPNFPGAFGPQGYPPAGYGPYGYPMPKPRRTGLIVGIVITSVVLLVGVGLTLYFVLRKSPTDVATGSAQGTAEAYLAAFENQDLTALSNMACKEDQDFITNQPDQVQGMFDRLAGATLSLNSVEENGKSAVVDVAAQHAAGGGLQLTVNLYQNNNGTWLVCTHPLKSVDQDR